MADEGHCYVCKRYFPVSHFYRDNSRRCGHQSKCKFCADIVRNQRRGSICATERNYDEMTDFQFMSAELDARVGDVNWVPPEHHGGAYQAEGVRSVRGAKTKNRPSKQVWGNKIRTR